MSAKSKMFVGLFLSATLSSTVLADGTWDVLSVADGLSSANISGIKGAVWVPNQFNNPVIDANGIVTFRSQIAGTGITSTGATANHVVVVRGAGGPWSVVMRNSSGVPGNTPADAIVARAASPNNSIVSANNLAANGGFLASGFMTGPGITVGTNDTAQWFVPPSGAPVLLAQGREICPGTAGAQYPANMTSSSGVRMNDNGESLLTVTLSGGDVSGTTNNSAIVMLRSGPDQLIVRKGDLAPGFAPLTVNPDAFGLFLNGSNYLFSAKLVGSGVTTANDSIFCTNAFAASGYRVFAREGDPIPGLKGLTIKNTSSLAFGQRPIAADGTITFIADLGGSATPINDKAVMTERNGVFAILMRKGDVIPGITDSADPNFTGKVLSTPSTSGFVRTSSGMIAFEGIFMNADGTAISSPAPSTYIGVRKADGTLLTVCRQTDPVPGLAGWTLQSLSGSTSICAAANGCVVFAASMTNGTDGGTALLAWDEVRGLRLLAKGGTTIGDTFFTNTVANQLTLIGGTGNNGGGSGTGFSDNGWLVLRAGDTSNQFYSIARIRVEPGVACPADLNGDGTVDSADLGALLSGWGTSSPDLDGNGTVDSADLGTLLSAWGQCN